MRLPEGFSWDPNLKPGPEIEILSRATLPKYFKDVLGGAVGFGEDLANDFDRKAQIVGVRENATHRLVAVLGALSSSARASSVRFKIIVNELIEQDPRFYEPLIARARELARALCASKFQILVRPQMKSDFPTLEMDEFLSRRTPQGELLDPALRAHERLGGKLEFRADDERVVKSAPSDWEHWLDERFERSGSYLIPGALVPLKVDLEQDLAEFREPEVWMSYRV